jgi:murein DD-endopeptidase MepM/ murein hydrolase activator NlpD
MICKGRRGVLMEKTISSEERIRRAEEIYNRRRTQTGVRVPTDSVNTNFNDKYKLYKKLILQIAICFVLYFICYLIKNSNYIFSEDFINKTKELLSYDINFNNTYNQIIEYYNNNLKVYFENSEESNNTNEEVQNSEIINTEEAGIGGGNDEELNLVAETTSITEQATTVDEETQVELSQMEIDANDIKANYSLILPLSGYTVTSRYGPRTATEIVSANHAGIDIAANEGTVFIASMEGTVITASSGATYGNHILIKNGDVITLYAHCKTLYVNEGDTIVQGQKLGEVGQTGNATGPHLHFEIRKDGRTVNPEFVLSF